MARETVTIRLVTRINRPLVYAGVLLQMAGNWLLARGIKVEACGT